MTPLGAHLRHLREEKNITLKQMSEALDVSAAYLSALEHGWRGVPQLVLMQQICNFFGLWEEDAEKFIKLAEISAPKITIDTGGLNPKATEFINILAKNIHLLDNYTLEWLIQEIEGPQRRKNSRYMTPPSVSRKPFRDFSDQ